MRVLTVLTVAAGMMLAGCASPQINGRDQWLAESQRTFKGRDKEQVLRAAEAVLRSIDGNTTFLHTPDTVESTRRWIFTIIIATVVGIDRIEVKTAPAADGTTVNMRITRQIISNDNSQASSISTVATYRLFFNWLGYALGLEENWISCDKASAELRLENADSVENAMCTSGSRGRNPVQPMPEWTRPSTVAKPAPVISRDMLRR